MSYPDPRYLRTEGEVSAKLLTSRPEPDAGSTSATSIRYVAGEETTGGEYGLYKVDMAPKTMGAKEHFHRAISESFYVLSGEVTL
ncbi:hypothetical protein [Streptomyces asiaticus]